MNARKMKDVAEEIAAHLDEILTLFKPGRKIALVSWHPGDPEKDMVMFDPTTTYDEVIDCLIRRRDSPTTQTHRTADER